MTKNVYWSSRKVPVILVRFNKTSIFIYIFSKNSQISSFMKIRPVGAELFHVNGRSDGRTWRS